MKVLDKLCTFSCSNCGSRTVIWDSFLGEIICRNCGMIVAKFNYCDDPEKRAFTLVEAESRSRTGLPTSFSIFDKGLPTIFTSISKDAYGKAIPYNTMIRMRRLKKLQSQSRFSQGYEKNLANAMTHIGLLSERLHIPCAVKEQAAIFYRKALKIGLVRGHSIHAIADACVYAACRISKIPRTINEIAYYSPVEKKDISKCYRLLLRYLHLKVPIPRAQSRLPRVANTLGINMETQRKATEILQEAQRLKMTSSKDPTGLAAAALYIACCMNETKVTQKQLSDASGVTEVTIRNRYKDLIRGLHLDL